jgi:hypothetical protein
VSAGAPVEATAYLADRVEALGGSLAAVSLPGSVRS